MLSDDEEVDGYKKHKRISKKLGETLNETPVLKKYQSEITQNVKPNL
jgi:hypothetical protein